MVKPVMRSKNMHVKSAARPQATRWLALGLGLGLPLLSACGRSAPQPSSVPAAEGQIAADTPELAYSERDWPLWRGPHGNGHAAEPVCTTWSETENVVWKSPVPGRGHASPCVAGNHVYIHTADEAAERMLLYCYDRTSGAQLWECQLHTGGFMHVHPKNSQASATPACDGERVFVPCMVQGALWLTAVDLQGTVAWQQRVGDFQSMHGYGSSPVLYKSLVIVVADHQGGGYVAAYDRESGDLVWRQPRTTAASFGTPSVATVAGRAQLLLAGGDATAGYDPATGDVLWSCPGPATTTACTLVWTPTHVITTGGYPQKEILCLPADKSGPLAEGDVAWRSTDGVAYVPSPLIDGPNVYLVSDNGVLTSFDVATGELRWRQRLGGDFSASLVKAGDVFYVPNEAGTVFVFRDNGQYEEVAQNNLADGGGFATPALCGGQIFLRTGQALYCLGSAPAESPSPAIVE